MSKQIFCLCRLQLVNLFGFNEFRYTTDRKKKARYLGLALVWLFMIVLAVFYVGTLSYGLASMGMADVIPMYLYAVASLLVLFFSFFKAGSTIFSVKGFDLLVSLPVSRGAVIISRFACMYLTNWMMTLVILVPGLICYATTVRPSVSFYVVYFLGSVFLPLLPLTISSVLGAAITAISSRSRHKSLVETILMLAVVAIVLGGSLGLSENGSQLTEEILQNMAQLLYSRIGKIYPPSLWFSEALSGDVSALVWMLGLPIVIFVVFIAVLQKYYLKICAGIHAVSTKNNYRMTRLQQNSHVTALWKRELKRYFSSSIYVTNTMVGYVMAVLVSAAAFFVGIEKVAALLGIPGVDTFIGGCVPYGLSCLLCMTSMTACSISMEGNTFWQIQTLPVTTKEFYDSKILANLSVAAPFYFLAEIFLILALRPTGLALVWLLLLPCCYLVFSCVTGITVNLMFPVLKWESEVRVVKQSASMFVTMVINIICSILPIVCIVIAGKKVAEWIPPLTILILLLVSAVLYFRNQKMSMTSIGER